MSNVPKMFHLSQLIVSAHQVAEVKDRKSYAVSDLPKCKQCTNRTANLGGLCRECLDLASVFVKL